MRRLFPAAAFLAIAAASLLMASFAYMAGEEAARFKFGAAADDALSRIEGRIEMHISLLRTTHALFEARGGMVSAPEFREFFRSLDLAENFPGLRGIGYLARVPNGQEPAIERMIGEQQGIEATIWPASNQEWRTPIVMFEPVASSRAFGFDMYTDELRRPMMDAAAETGEPRATGHLELGRASGVEPYSGFLVFKSLDTPGVHGRESTQGFLFAAFRSETLIKEALDRIPQLPVSIAIHDGATTESGVLYRSPEPPDLSFSETYAVVRNILVAGRPWAIVFRPTAAFTKPSSPMIAASFAVLGLLLAVTIAMVARYQMRAHDAAETLQAQAERSLMEKDLMLQEMKHRIKNLIARILAIGRQTAAGASTVAEFSESFAARLQAMAASQDMLTRSRWQRAELGELLRIELGQVFGKDLPDMLSGPKVMLSEAVTQALGLTFHELATNALKYGQAGVSRQALRIEWNLAGPERQRELVMTWMETGGPVKPPQRVGFGTKLIDMNVVRELGGEIHRDYHGDGLTIRIRIPLKDA